MEDVESGKNEQPMETRGVPGAFHGSVDRSFSALVDLPVRSTCSILMKWVGSFAPPELPMRTRLET